MPQEEEQEKAQDLVELRAVVAPPDATLRVDENLLAQFRQDLLQLTEGFVVEELELLSADLAAVVNSKRGEWDRSAMIEVRL